MLLHVLNNCNTALHHQTYNERHDEVLKEISSFITVNLKASQSMIVHLSSQKYSIPSHLPCNDLRPDIIWWDELSNRSVLVDITNYFDTPFKQDAERKRRKNLDMCENSHHEVSLSGYLISIEHNSPWKCQSYLSNVIKCYDFLVSLFIFGKSLQVNEVMMKVYQLISVNEVTKFHYKHNGPWKCQR